MPSAAAVVGGDVVYNGVHMMTAETDENSREALIDSLDAVAALNPQIVVAGGGGVEDIVNAMLRLHGDRDNPRTLWHSARTAVAKRG